MTRQELIISDLSNAVLEKELLTSKSHPNCWEVLTYETAEVSGSLLWASELSFPQPVTIKPELSGWYKIYVCLADMGGGVLKNRIDLKLTDDEFASTLRAGDLGRRHSVGFHISEVIEEAFWKCADMTEQTVTIAKVDDQLPHTSNIYWLRFVPMSDEEVAEYKNRIQDPSRKTLFAHMDGDFHMFDNAIAPHDFCKPFYAMKDSDVGIVCQEVCNDLIDYSTFDEVYAARDAITKRRMEYFRYLSENKEAVYKEQIAYAHKCGMQFFAGHRMQLSNFAFPYNFPMFTIPFVTEHPELRMKLRNGITCDFLSYAYPETQEFVINNILESAAQGFDGILLIFNRGQHLGFEEPVAERYRAKYGDTADFYRLPQNHPCLLEIYSDIMSEFFVKLRTALNDFAVAHKATPLKVYLNTFFTIEDTLIHGFDLDRLAENGLIDGFIQTKQSVIEETDDVLAEDGLIDLEKYFKKAQTEYIYKRYTSSDIAKLADNASKFRKIADRYDVAFHTEIQWEGFQAPEAYVKGANAVYNAGASRIALWDCYPIRVQGLAEWAGTSQMGTPEHVAKMSKDGDAYHRVIKVYSYNNVNIQYINPSWRG